jgi:DNA-binding response OmpR family regulator
MRVLFVDDHFDTAEIMCKVIRTMGHECQALTTFDDAFEALHQQRFDLLMTDLALDGKSGTDLMKEAMTLNVPSIVVTGYASACDKQDALDAGFIEHLAKPLDFVELEAALTRVQSRLLASQRLEMDSIASKGLN